MPRTVDTASDAAFLGELFAHKDAYLVRDRFASIGEANFAWIVDNMADVLVERVRNPRPFEFTGSWSRGLIAPDVGG